MKYIPNTNHSRVPRIIGIGLLACSMLISFSCDNKTPEPDKPETQASHLEKASLKSIPPGVERATIQPLEKSTDQGNALLVVKFDQRDPRINKKSSEVALFPADKQRVVLTDSGKNGDREAGDGLFSAIIDFDFEALIKMAASSEKRFEKRQSHAVFRGREIIGVENRELMQKSFTRLQELGSAQDIIRDRTVIDLSDIFFLFDVLSIDPERSLIVTAPGVVQDPTRTIDPCTSTGNPDGVWTFKHLVSEMVSGTGVDPADFVEQWLMLWTSNQTVSSDFVAAPRSDILARVLNPWPRTASGKLDLDKSPFRLAAIVNRTDLSENLVYGSGSAGEGRFVFGVRDANAESCQFFRFSVIFEYGVEKNGCSGLKDWAQQWKALATHTLGSPEYNLALEAITRQFTAAGAAPGKPNGSALNQLRTNENALVTLWELREFRISDSSHMLFEDTTKQTPDETLNNTAVLASYINANAGAIVTDSHVVPDHFPGPTDPFLAATSRASSSQLSTHFKAPAVADNPRFHFSLNTCSACHIRETSTNGSPTGNTAFLHVDPTEMPAKLSRFMTGSTESIMDLPDLFAVVDPVNSSITHNFNDLDRRRRDLAAKADMFCIARIVIPPIELQERWPFPIPPEKLPPVPDPRLDGIMDTIRMVH